MIVALGVFVNFIVIFPPRCVSTLKRCKRLKKNKQEEKNKIHPSKSTQRFKEDNPLDSINLSLQRDLNLSRSVSPLFTRAILPKPGIPRNLEFIKEEEQAQTRERQLQSFGESDNEFFYI